MSVFGAVAILCCASVMIIEFSIFSLFGTASRACAHAAHGYTRVGLCFLLGFVLSKDKYSKDTIFEDIHSLRISLGRL